MPFQSEKQRRYMHANLPEIAKRWERDYANGGIMRLAHGGRTGFFAAGLARGDSISPGTSTGGGMRQGDEGKTQHIQNQIKQNISKLGAPPGMNTRTGHTPKSKGFFSGLGNWAGKLRGWNEKYGRPNTQKEYNEARQSRINSQRVQNILGREAPITKAMQTRLSDLGYKGARPAIGSTPTSRAIQNDPDYLSDMNTGYSRAHLQSLADKQALTSKLSAKDFINLDQSIPASDYKSRSFIENLQRKFPGVKLAKSPLNSWKQHAIASEHMGLTGVGSHQKKGWNFAQNFPTLARTIGPSLARGYQYAQELGRAILDGPGNYTMGQAWKEAGKQSDANIQGMQGKGFNKDEYNDWMASHGYYD